MTYCVAIKLKAGLVFLSDSRATKLAGSLPPTNPIAP